MKKALVFAILLLLLLPLFSACTEEMPAPPERGYSVSGIVLLEQVRTLDKRRLKEKMGNLDSEDMMRVNKALSVSFGLGTGNT